MTISVTYIVKVITVLLAGLIGVANAAQLDLTSTKIALHEEADCKSHWKAPMTDRRRQFGRSNDHTPLGKHLPVRGDFIVGSREFRSLGQ